MIDLIPLAQRDRLQTNRLAVRVHSLRNGICARITLEQIVEAAILLNDVDDVRNFSRSDAIGGA